MARTIETARHTVEHHETHEVLPSTHGHTTVTTHETHTTTHHDDHHHPHEVQHHETHHEAHHTSAAHVAHEVHTAQNVAHAAHVAHEVQHVAHPHGHPTHEVHHATHPHHEVHEVHHETVHHNQAIPPHFPTLHSTVQAPFHARIPAGTTPGHAPHCVPLKIPVHNGVHETEEVVHEIKLHPEWTDITPTHRHGQEKTRVREANDHVTLVHTLIVEHDPLALKDWARLEFMHLDELPETHHRHEVYSTCISKDVNQIVLVKDPEKPHVTQKILYLADHTMWTEPQVNAIILMMHAHLAPGGLKAGLRDDDGIKNAEKFADHYCRTVGVQRSELPTLHSSGTPHRVSRGKIVTIKNKEPVRTYHGKGVIPPNYSEVLYRQDSQTPLKLHPETGYHQEHGGVESTVVVTPSGLKKALSNRIESEDIHYGSEEMKIQEKQRKKEEKRQRKLEKRERKAAKKAAKKGQVVHVTHTDAHGHTTHHTTTTTAAHHTTHAPVYPETAATFHHKYITPKSATVHHAPVHNTDSGVVHIHHDGVAHIEPHHTQHITHETHVVETHHTHPVVHHTTEDYWTNDQAMKVSPIQI